MALRDPPNNPKPDNTTAVAGDEGLLLSQKNGNVQVDLAGLTKGNLPVQQQSAIKLEDTSGTNIDPAEARTQVTDTQDQKDIESSTYTNQFDVTPNMETVNVSVDDATGSFNVAVAFQDGNGNDIVVRDNQNSTEYSGDSNSDVFVSVELSAPQVEVRVDDDSGAQNEVDIAMRAN